MFQAGDDGDYEAGWWLRRLNANNRIRFIPKTIGGDDIVFDRASGLMWAADGNAQGCDFGNSDEWHNAIVFANIVTFAGFTDWRMPSIKELFSIANYATVIGIDTTFFPNTFSTAYWSSTTDRTTTTRAWIIDFIAGTVVQKTKTLISKLRCVRLGL